MKYRFTVKPSLGLAAAAKRKPANLFLELLLLDIGCQP